MLTLLTGNYEKIVHNYIAKTLYSYYTGISHDQLMALADGSVLNLPAALLDEQSNFQLGLDLCSVDKNLSIITHNNSLFNGIRVGVKRGLIKPEDLTVHFYSSDGQITYPKIDARGRFTPWPDGFFDMWDKALEELLDD